MRANVGDGVRLMRRGARQRSESYKPKAFPEHEGKLGNIRSTTNIYKRRMGFKATPHRELYINKGLRIKISCIVGHLRASFGRFA